MKKKHKVSTEAKAKDGDSNNTNTSETELLDLGAVQTWSTVAYVASMAWFSAALSSPLPPKPNSLTAVFMRASPFSFIPIHAQLTAV